MKDFRMQGLIIQPNEGMEGVPHGAHSLAGQRPARAVLLWLLLVCFHHGGGQDHVDGGWGHGEAAALVGLEDLGEENYRK